MSLASQSAGLSFLALRATQSRPMMPPRNPTISEAAVRESICGARRADKFR
jgi:hypothetical protein